MFQEDDLQQPAQKPGVEDDDLSRAETTITAGLNPGYFAKRGLVTVNRKLLIAALTLFVLLGFGVRVPSLSAEGLSEDELNKLQAVGDYRAQGLTSANSEHPFLMKALLEQHPFSRRPEPDLTRSGPAISRHRFWRAHGNSHLPARRRIIRR